MVCLLFYLTIAGGDWTPEAIKTAESLRDKAMKDTPAYSYVSSLVLEVGPRLAGTEADHAAIEWAMARCRKIGFDKVWMERFEVPRWERGEARVTVLDPFQRRELVATALGLSVGTSDKGISGEIVAIPTYEALLEATESQVRGKIVFITNRMERSRDGMGYARANPARTRGAIAAARKGAVGLLIRSLGTEPHRFAHTGMMRYEEGVPRIPAAALANPDANLLERMVANSDRVRLNLRLTCRFLGTAETANVIAELKGRSRPDEIVLLGAHLDSWDEGEGAIDDGAGVAIVLAAAQMLKELDQRPDRTVRVVLFGAEEIGLLGAEDYAEKHGNEKHVIGSESDFGAGKVYWLGSYANDAADPAFEQMLNLLKPLGIEGHRRVNYAGPDMRPMAKYGLPTFYLAQDGTDYFDYHHTPDDTLDKIDKTALDQNVAAWAVVAWLAAEKKGYFGPVPIKKVDAK